MSISGKEAVALLESIKDRVTLFKKDGTNKFWSYKLNHAKRTEFAFDPNTTTGLFIRVDRELPALAGVGGVEKIVGKDVSTALGRIFSGGLHKPNYKASIDSADTFLEVIAHYESL
ncbi:MAG: hypothetical protein P8R04_01790 [Gammaproteobacteria bacterium]|nr:hypothetical protein [Gammaproteobacteria bacterium]